jgi:predicted DNA-binding protein (MmcQ/YjbR family)
MTTAQFRKVALSFEEATEAPHFEKLSFRVNGKIFATVDEKAKRATLRLSPDDQGLFSKAHKTISPVPNKWGKQGWTVVDLSNTRRDVIEGAVTAAFITVAPKKLAERILGKINHRRPDNP